MTDELLRNRERPGDNQAQPPTTVKAAPRELLRGASVGISRTRVVCLGCGANLGEGRAVMVYGYRGADRETWDVGR